MFAAWTAGRSPRGIDRRERECRVPAEPAGHNADAVAAVLTPPLFSPFISKQIMKRRAGVQQVGAARRPAPRGPVPLHPAGDPALAHRVVGRLQRRTGRALVSENLSQRTEAVAARRQKKTLCWGGRKVVETQKGERPEWLHQYSIPIRHSVHQAQCVPGTVSAHRRAPAGPGSS